MGDFHVTDVKQLVARAREAQPGWERVAPAERGSLLRQVADAVEAVAGRLAELTTDEMGKSPADARGGVDAGIGTLRQYAELGPLHRGRSLLGGRDAVDLMAPRPRGVVAAITPWNDPVAVSCGLLGAALVTGNTVVFKPSERTPQTGVELAAAFAAVLPDDVLVLAPGDGAVGADLAAADVDLVAHVGSTATGRSIARACAARGAAYLLENGGNDPLIVDAGVDPAWAAEQAALGAFANAGQICTSVERIYVVAELADAFVGELVAAAGGWDQPLVDRRHRDAVHAQVASALEDGARALTGGSVPDGPGSSYPATVLTGCTDTMTVMREETFGPVAPVRVVEDFDEALAAAAGSGYGLAATVLTPSTAHAQRAWRELPVGTLKVNAVFGGAPGGAAEPRGVSGSGFGYGPELLDEMTTTSVLHWSAPRPAGQRGGSR
jgi:succinate-semialdehyde dehydrogenase/glutarate-semialdehyde dehydrogenase